MCVHEDMVDRMPVVVKCELEALLLHYRSIFPAGKIGVKKRDEVTTEFLDAAVEIMLRHRHLFDPRCKTPCARHRKACHAYPYLLLHDAQSFLRGNIAGMSCLDWSARGQQAGTCGKGAMAWLTLMWDYLNNVYDFAIAERTKNYAHRHLQRVVTHCDGTVHEAIFSPTDLGFPASRGRK